jgi:hypothetical protein
LDYALCKKLLLKQVFQKKPPALAGGVVTSQPPAKNHPQSHTKDHEDAINP